MLLGLKASTDQRQIRDRLQYHPDVFEFHLTEMILPKLDGRILYRWQH